MKQLLYTFLLLLPALTQSQSTPNGSLSWDVELTDLDTAFADAGADKTGATGTSDQNKSDLWIAPNPSYDFLNVYARIPPAGNVSITVYNMLGGRLHSFQPLIQNNTLILHADATSWLPGTYLVRIENNGTVMKTMRFVKR